MKRIITIITSAILLEVLLCACNNSASYADTEFISTLENNLIDRQEIADTEADSTTLEHFSKLVNTEKTILKYENKDFKDYHLKELAINYIDGLKRQQESLDYYSDIEKFNKLWQEGYLQRSKSAIELMESYNLNIPENTRSAFEDDINSSDEVPTIQENNNITIPKDILDILQGEWKSEKSNWHLIIHGTDVDAMYYENYGDIVEEGNHETYILSDIDADGNIIVNRFLTHKYTYVITDENRIESHSADNKIVHIYNKVSENTELPQVEIKEIPHIGMTESEVYNSTWGTPKKRNQTVTANGVRLQLVYDKGYIYLENGYVTAIQTR